MNTCARIFIKVQDIPDWQKLVNLGDLDRFYLFDAKDTFDIEDTTTLTLGINLGDWGCEPEPLVEFVRLLASKLPKNILIVADCFGVKDTNAGIAVWYLGTEVHAEMTKELACQMSEDYSAIDCKIKNTALQLETNIYEVVAWLAKVSAICDVDEMNYLADFNIYLTKNTDCRDENDYTFYEDDEDDNSCEDTDVSEEDEDS